MKLGHGTKDMTSGPIAKAIVLFSLPLMLGNAFQMLYNTVDIIVVGNFVSKQALGGRIDDDDRQHPRVLF